MPVHLTKLDRIALAAMWVAITFSAVVMIDTPIVRWWMCVIAALVTAVVNGRGVDSNRNSR